MTQERKSFFRERSKREIAELRPASVYQQRNLVRRILDLPADQAIELRFPLTPARFSRNTGSSAEASRKCWHHGDLVGLSQPMSQGDAYSCREIPLAIRARDFSRLRGIREEDIDFIGYSFYPVQGRDRRKRVVPFVWIPAAAQLYAYAEHMTAYEEAGEIRHGIKVKPFIDAGKVRREGADVVCSVPSRTKKKPRYLVKLRHVAVEGSTERRAVAYCLKSNFEIEPEHRTWGEIRYPWEDAREGEDRFTFYPHDIAAYFAVIKDFTAKHNLTPFEMSPLAIPSRAEAEFYKRLCNNVLVYDPSLLSVDKRRKLHLDEKCILIARSIGVLGHDETMYWDAARDGRLRDYDWSA